jgi:hypothetical protein
MWEIRFVDDRAISVVEQDMELGAEALDASAIVAAVDSRFNLTVDGVWCCDVGVVGSS